MPIVGGLSDRFGRRPVMLASLFGLSLDYFIMGFAPTIAFLFLGRIIAGAFGATFSTANAYVADRSARALYRGGTYRTYQCYLWLFLLTRNLSGGKTPPL